VVRVEVVAGVSLFTELPRAKVFSETDVQIIGQWNDTKGACSSRAEDEVADSTTKPSSGRLPTRCISAEEMLVARLIK
jgi:hypothetical protein